MPSYEFTFKCVESGDTPEEAWESATQNKGITDVPEYEIIEEDE